MSDWGTGATSSKKPAAVSEQVILYGPYNCIHCGMSYMPRRVYYGDYICPKCEKAEPKHTPRHPPASVQMTIEETFGAKK